MQTTTMHPTPKAAGLALGWGFGDGEVDVLVDGWGEAGGDGGRQPLRVACRVFVPLVKCIISMHGLRVLGSRPTPPLPKLGFAVAYERTRNKKKGSHKTGPDIPESASAVLAGSKKQMPRASRPLCQKLPHGVHNFFQKSLAARVIVLFFCDHCRDNR